MFWKVSGTSHFLFLHKYRSLFTYRHAARRLDFAIDLYTAFILHKLEKTRVFQFVGQCMSEVFKFHADKIAKQAMKNFVFA